MSKPLLTIGMIFKNEIRCLERCMKSLQPLREAVPCELVMADTGSNDGSREIAEKYADILFDFPWINDFSAARNAVMDRAHGEWYLTIDADEWLDEDVSQLVKFLKDYKKQTWAYCAVVLRNYTSADLDENYKDFLAVRMIHMSTGIRYEGAIHEHWRSKKGGPECIVPLNKAIFYHDGYIGLGEDEGREKLERNLTLLREQLKKRPDDLFTLMQYLESGTRESDYLERLRQAISGVEEKLPDWDKAGAPIFRYAVVFAREKRLPELEEWIARAEECFPDSTFTRIDVAYVAFGHSWDQKDYAGCIRRGEQYRRALVDHRAGRGDQNALLYSTLMMATPHWEMNLCIFLANSYVHEGETEKAYKLLKSLDCKVMDDEQTRNYLLSLRELHTQSKLDTAPLILAFWEGIGVPEPSKKRADQRKVIFEKAAQMAFQTQIRDEEENREGFCRPSYTLFLPLEELCEAGLAARIMELEDTAEIELALNGVKSWDKLPIQALIYALGQGVRFPIPEKPLYLEEMGEIAGRLSLEGEILFQLACRQHDISLPEDPQGLCWARMLSLAAVQAYDWKDVQQGMELLRRFAEVEQAFLRLCYGPAVLEEGRIHIISAANRFGWFLYRAFDALDEGDGVSYVRLLREGLAACSGMKPAVEFLLTQFRAGRIVDAPPELLELAEKVKAVLAAYPADDPSVTMLKASPAYRQVAFLLKEPEEILQ